MKQIKYEYLTDTQKKTVAKIIKGGEDIFTVIEAGDGIVRAYVAGKDSKGEYRYYCNLDTGKKTKPQYINDIMD